MTSLGAPWRASMMGPKQWFLPALQLLLMIRRRMMIFGLLLAALALVATDLNSAQPQAQSAVPNESTDGKPVAVIQTYKDGSGVCTGNVSVHLSVGRDPSILDEPVLIVEYPAPSDDPAERDVLCDAENHDWTAGGAISFRIKPDHSVRLSLSFLDRNRVVYTSWTDLKGGMWQPVRIAFDQIRPNPYFQPSGARVGSRIDVSEVKGIAFAPHDQTSGRLAISKFVVVK